jgi:hypothetical protein
MTIKAMTPAEVHARLSNPEQAVEMHREAIKEGVSFSRYLEAVDPSPEGSRLNAFQRQLKLAGIITKSNPKEGYWASEAGVFFKTPAGRALFPEFFVREWRSVTFATPQERAILLSSDAVVGDADRPWLDAGPFWNNQFAPAIPLAELVARTTAITGEDYRSIYMTYDAEALRLFRIGESAEIPMANLATSERNIRLKKYGRGLRATYEQIRRTRVDTLGWWVRWMALQSEVDKVSAALDVLVAGDGNAGTGATESNLLTLDPTATPNELTMLGWLKWRMLFTQPYAMTTVLGRVDEIVQLMQLNLGTANIPLANFNLAGVGNSLTPINATADGIRYGWTEEAPDGKLVGFDARFALEHITEIGSEISETEKFITNQTEVITFTENSAFAIIDPAAVRVLDFSE